MPQSTEHYLKRELDEFVRSGTDIFKFQPPDSFNAPWIRDVELPTEEWLSPQFKELLGYRDEEIPNTAAWRQANISPEDLPVMLESLRRLCADPGYRCDQVVRYRHKHGTTVWIRCRGIALRDAHGKAIRIVGSHTDVTAIVQAHELMSRPAGAAERAAHAQAERMLAGVSDAMVALDRDWRYVYVNDHAGRIFGRRPEDLVGKHIWTEFPEGVGQPFYHAYHRAMAEQVPVELEEYYPPYDRWFENRIHPTPDGLTIFFHDITVRKQAEAKIKGQGQVLEMVARGEALPQVLDTLLRFLESQSRDMLCSILLLDDGGLHVRHGAAPSLPAEFCRAIDGAPIGANAGSCGTAAYRREPVFVTDIASDPLWADYKELALPHGLRACWSTPIFDADRKVLGTFAIYHRQSGRPTARHRELIGFATHTAAICISRQRAAAALKASEERYALAVRGTSDGLWDWNIQTNKDYLSPRWKELLGFADHELPSVAESFYSRLHPDDLPRAQAAVQAHLQHRVPYDIEVRLRTKDAGYRSFRSRGQAEWDEQGRPTRMAGAISDITRQKQAEQALQDTAEFNRQIIADANEGVAVLDRQLRYTVWNPFLEELLGLPAAEVIGRHPLELFPWMQEGGQLAALNGALAGEAITMPDSQRLKTGHKRISWLQSRLAPLRDGQGEITGVIAMIADVTEYKQVENNLRNSHEQLRALAARLQSVREEQSAHIAREIHDVLGQQLTALKLDLAWLKRRVATLKEGTLQAALVEKLIASAGLVDATIQNVQKIATELRPGLLDKLGLAAALEREVRDFAGRSGLRCKLEMDRKPAGLDQNRTIGVFRICQEMLTNVARHAQASQVEVRLVHRQGWLVLEVSDNGRGIADQQLAGLKSLGLLGMRERAQILGGRLDISGSPGQGTKAMLAVPLSSAP